MISGIKHHLAVGQDGLALAEMDHGRGQQADAGVAMLLVVPVKELLTEGAAVLDAAEAVRELRAVLQGAELAFRIRVVIGNIRPAVGLGDAQVAIRKATGLEVMTRPRSAWMLSWPAGTWCLWIVSSMNCLASSAPSRYATIQPVT